MKGARLLLLPLLMSSCDGRSKQPAPAPAPEGSIGVGVAGASGAAPVAEHEAEHDPHPPSAPPQVATATALTADARSKLTMLRVMAHVGAVIVRKENDAWVVSGPNGCRVAP